MSQKAAILFPSNDENFKLPSFNTKTTSQKICLLWKYCEYLLLHNIVEYYAEALSFSDSALRTTNKCTDPRFSKCCKRETAFRQSAKTIYMLNIKLATDEYNKQIQADHF